MRGAPLSNCLFRPTLRIACASEASAIVPPRRSARPFRAPGRRACPVEPPQPRQTADDAIWYSESGVRPNTLVRFDSETETFQTWAIPSGGGRNMMATSDGAVALVEIAGN
jgi:hypothetical protein